MSSEEPDSSNPPPKYDNFYTPANGEFYSTFEYQNLEKKKHLIRLIKLLSTGSGRIECELIDELPLDGMRGKYSALSYCAGTPRKPKKSPSTRSASIFLPVLEKHSMRSSTFGKSMVRGKSYCFGLIRSASIRVILGESLIRLDSCGISTKVPSRL
jgi:hypothetical protein